MGVGISRKSMVGLKVYGPKTIFEIFFGPKMNFENDLKIRF